MRQRLLIVDDHPLQLQILSDLFSSRPTVKVDTCLSAEDAYVRCRIQEYDLVITDLEMAGVDGIQFIQRLANLACPPPLAIVSAHGGRILACARLVAVSMGLKVVGVLRKPVQATHTAELLGELVRVQHCPRHRVSIPRAEPKEGELRQALLDGRITAWFQPKFCVKSGRTVAAEAVVHWMKERKDAQTPAQFLTSITQLGLEKELFLQVLSASIDAQHQWLAAGLQIAVSVNLPIDLLEQPSLPDELLAFVEQRGGQQTQLSFELEGDSLTRSAGDYHAGACRLRMKGFALAQDGFGHGASSFHDLVNIPFNEIKLARELVNGCSRDPALGMTVANMLSLIRQLGMTSVALGVEDDEDFELLKRLKCDLVQGHLISRPLPVSDFTHLVGTPDA